MTDFFSCSAEALWDRLNAPLSENEIGCWAKTTFFNVADRTFADLGVPEWSQWAAAMMRAMAGDSSVGIRGGYRDRLRLAAWFVSAGYCDRDWLKRQIKTDLMIKFISSNEKASHQPSQGEAVVAFGNMDVWMDFPLLCALNEWSAVRRSAWQKLRHVLPPLLMQRARSADILDAAYDTALGPLSPDEIGLHVDREIFWALKKMGRRRNG